MAAWIDKDLEEYVRNCFPDRYVSAYHKSGTWQTSRYIQVSTCLKEEKHIHYEYYREHIELHLEGKFQSEDYRQFAKELRQQTSRTPKLSWHSWQGRSQCRCRLDAPVHDEGAVVNSLKEIVAIFDKLIKNAYNAKNRIPQTFKYEGESIFTELGLQADEVSLEKACLGKIFSNRLVIPDYQRNYCWDDKQVNLLWNSLLEIPANGEYHLGSIILQKDNKSGSYAIIDGQQRLVTLTLVLKELGYEGNLPLLSQTFLSERSKLQIANNKWLIHKLFQRMYDEDLGRKILNNLTFSILILNESRLDLAYTFFSNQNAKGVPLSDFDLLKAHHLRFIFDEKQSEHISGKWNSLIEDKYADLDKTLSTHIYRLRKWMRKKNYNVDEVHRVKEEYSADLIIPDIPAFGESFSFYEKIQGGSHFFAYADHFVARYESFSKTGQVQLLRKHLQWSSHWRYADVIESLLFGYYLKFGEQYLSEALLCISAFMAQHRYSSARAISHKIREYAQNSEIVMMIDQSSSPTFFLAECRSNVKITGREIEETGIQMDFYQKLLDMTDELTTIFPNTLTDII